MKKKPEDSEQYAEDMIRNAYGKATDLIGEAWIEINWVKPNEMAYGIRKVGRGIGMVHAIYIAHFEHRESKRSARKYTVIRPHVEKNKLFYGKEGLNFLRKYVLFLKS